MTQTITALPVLAAPIVPQLLERASYDSTSEVRNQLHPIIGRADVEATLYPAGLATGTLVLIFDDRAAAFAAYAAHRDARIFTLTDTDVPDASMNYITQGTVQLTLDPDTAREWLLRVGFQQVP